jgi:hypothetical protein
MLKLFADPRKILTQLLMVNIALDVLSIPIWVAVPSLQSTTAPTTLSVNYVFATADAAAAVVVFAVALLGISNRKTWGSILAIAGTLAQRVVGVFLFPQVNGFMVMEVVWSVIIIYFAYRTLKQPPSMPQLNPLPQTEAPSA